jgi:phospholipase C
MSLPKYVFTLMLENRSFDHMLGYSGITGTDPVTGKRVPVNGLTQGGTHVNEWNGKRYEVQKGAPWCVPVGPKHEFDDVFEQLVGPGQTTPVSPYPQPVNTGFAANYGRHGGDPQDVMRCFDTAKQLPVLHALASEYVVCDNWFASIPGPTGPNRFFVHAASSAGLDHSPSVLDMGLDYSFEPFHFQHSQIFEYLEEERIFWTVLSGYWLPQSFAMEGMRGYWHKPNLRFIDRFDELLEQIHTQDKRTYVFVEPNYGHIVTDTYRCGTSQHAMDDVTRGEWLIKAVYEKLRASKLWDECALVITWDEHGGFYDHVPPPPATPPGDGPYGKNNKFGFGFDRYGVRVPAVLVSPLTERNLVDRRPHDHTSVLAMLETCFDLGSFTKRDYAEFQSGQTLATLFTRDTPRGGCPKTLPDPAKSGALTECTPLRSVDDVLTLPVFDPLDQDPDKPEVHAQLAGFVHIAHLVDVSISRPDESDDRAAKFRSALQGTRQTQVFMGEVQQRLFARSKKLAAPQAKPGLLRRLLDVLLRRSSA